MFFQKGIIPHYNEDFLNQSVLECWLLFFSKNKSQVLMFQTNTAYDRSLSISSSFFKKTFSARNRSFSFSIRRISSFIFCSGVNSSSVFERHADLLKHPISHLHICGPIDRFVGRILSELPPFFGNPYGCLRLFVQYQCSCFSPFGHTLVIEPLIPSDCPFISL